MDPTYVKSVMKSLKNHYGNIPLYVSTKKDKKFMIQAPDGNFIHFGAKGYDDWHSHHDEKRLANFQKRNAKWKNADKYTPAHLAYWVLWN